MKNIFKLAVVVFLTFNFAISTLQAQTPSQFKYQAVLHNADGNIIANEAVTIDISILKGSASGTSVFDETHNANTTAQGLINLNIGSVEDLSIVDWSADNYFIKITVNSVEMGTSQLLSVPYAMHAKTAEKLVPGTPKHYIGELYGGGVVFWVDSTGEHGLIVSMIDLSTGARWSNIDDVEIGSDARSDWNGQSNSTVIMSQSGFTDGAAKLCDDYTNEDYGTGTYSNWYLPSITEFKILWDHFYEVQKTLDTDGNSSTTIIKKWYYWTSNEQREDESWVGILENYNIEFGHYFKSDSHYVRAIRTF